MKRTLVDRSERIHIKQRKGKVVFSKARIKFKKLKTLEKQQRHALHRHYARSDKKNETYYVVGNRSLNKPEELRRAVWDKKKKIYRKRNSIIFTLLRKNRYKGERTLKNGVSMDILPVFKPLNKRQRSFQRYLYKYIKDLPKCISTNPRNPKNCKTGTERNMALHMLGYKFRNAEERKKILDMRRGSKLYSGKYKYRSFKKMYSRWSKSKAGQRIIRKIDFVKNIGGRYPDNWKKMTKKEKMKWINEKKRELGYFKSYSKKIARINYPDSIKNMPKGKAKTNAMAAHRRKLQRGDKPVRKIINYGPFPDWWATAPKGKEGNKLKNKWRAERRKEMGIKIVRKSKSRKAVTSPPLPKSSPPPLPKSPPPSPKFVVVRDDSKISVKSKKKSSKKASSVDSGSQIVKSKKKRTKWVYDNLPELWDEWTTKDKNRWRAAFRRKALLAQKGASIPNSQAANADGGVSSIIAAPSLAKNNEPVPKAVSKVALDNGTQQVVNAISNMSVPVENAIETSIINNQKELEKVASAPIVAQSVAESVNNNLNQVNPIVTESVPTEVVVQRIKKKLDQKKIFEKLAKKATIRVPGKSQVKKLPYFGKSKLLNTSIKGDRRLVKNKQILNEYFDGVHNYRYRMHKLKSLAYNWDDYETLLKALACSRYANNTGTNCITRYEADKVRKILNEEMNERMSSKTMDEIIQEVAYKEKPKNDPLKGLSAAEINKKAMEILNA